MCAQASGYLLKSGDLEAIERAIHDVLNGGAPMTPGVARRVLGLFNPNIGNASTVDYSLTPREAEILDLMVEALITRGIATRPGSHS